jgi:hypothetical protein
MNSTIKSVEVSKLVHLSEVELFSSFRGLWGLKRVVMYRPLKRRQFEVLSRLDLDLGWRELGVTE